jgi:hypothetical protein
MIADEHFGNEYKTSRVIGYSFPSLTKLTYFRGLPDGYKLNEALHIFYLGPVRPRSQLAEPQVIKRVRVTIVSNRPVISVPESDHPLSALCWIAESPTRPGYQV